MSRELAGLPSGSTWAVAGRQVWRESEAEAVRCDCPRRLRDALVERDERRAAREWRDRRLVGTRAMYGSYPPAYGGLVRLPGLPYTSRGVIMMKREMHGDFSSRPVEGVWPETAATCFLSVY